MSGLAHDSPGYRLLIVDDETMVLRSMRRVLQQYGHTVYTASSGAEALEVLVQRELDVAILDLALQDMSGLDVLRAIKGHDATVECVVMTGHTSAPTALAAYDAGAVEYFEKPILDWDRFREVLDRAARQTRLARERDQDTVSAPSGSELLLRRELAGGSKAIEELRRSVAQWAPRVGHLLVVGPPGSGKGRVTTLLHRLSGRTGAMEVLSCGDLRGRDGQRELVGGVEARGGEHDAGAVERAAGGTLVLRDVDLLAPDLQLELVRALDRQEGAADLPRRTRVIATIGREPEAGAHAGPLREELLWRLSGRLRVPGLAERRDDIPQLVYQMVRQINAEEQTDVRRVPSDAMTTLIEHDWSDGNLRALRQAVAAAVLASPGEALERSSLPLVGRPAARDGGDLPDDDRLPERYRGLSYAEFKERLLNDYMGAYVRDLLDATGGNVTRAARLAGLHRPNFRRLMKRYGIEVDDEDDDA